MPPVSTPQERRPTGICPGAPSLQHKVVNKLHLEDRTRHELEITSPNPARAQHLFLKPDLGPKAKFTDGVDVCATARLQKRSVRLYLQVHGFIRPKMTITLTKTLACKNVAG